MGGRGGSSGLGSSSAKTQQFEGSEKQVKWANDIVSEAKRKLEDFLQSEIDFAKRLGLLEKDRENLESQKLINEISINTLSNLEKSWGAKDVIENREKLNSSSVIDIRQKLGIFERAKYPDFKITSVKIRDGGNTYDMDKLKSSKSEQKKMEKELLDYLKKHK